MVSQLSPKFQSAAITDIGRVRRQNEDRFLRLDALRLYAVADGIGGLPAGATAAQIAVDQLEACAGESSISRASGLTPWFRAANEAVALRGRQISPSLGIGTTLTCGVIHESLLLLAHVDDSRCYRLRAGTATCLTVDHSVANEQKQRAAQGEVFPAVTDSRALAALTRCIGQFSVPAIDTFEVEINSGDRFLFLTDGIFRVIPDDELCSLLGTAASMTKRLADLIAAANHRGGPDNATAVLIEPCPESNHECRPYPTIPKTRRPTTRQRPLSV
ncbi:MAG: serine/threonine-protein phosphatase [Candidatus Synoicihabitans palmerolidicus]|nr:serine/threonine-protein phosphatase [Candidatus Synoicihabitans palmerolidicus]